MSKVHDDAAAADRERARRRIVWRTTFTAFAFVVLLVAFGAWNHHHRAALAAQALDERRNAIPAIRVKELEPVSGPRQVQLPASTQGFDSATVFARATGYIAERKADIGSRVHAGDLLATIAAPDLDQQLAQARAQLTQLDAALAQANANAELARVTNERTSQLVPRGIASKQQGDTDRQNFSAMTSAVHVAQGNRDAQQAQVSRLEQMTGFERVVAPFDGVITDRQIDVGSLVTADSASGTPLFQISRTNKLRVQVYVPQNAVFGLKVGAEAQVTVPEIPGRTFHGVITRDANALQAGTRTLLTEIDVDNPDGTLFPGLYCNVELSIPRQQPVVVVPSTAIIFDRNGLSASVYEDGVAHLRKLDIVTDNGAEVEVRGGLQGGDRVILNPPADLSDGMHVRLADSK
jgi:RND family efflux transporter MFP subunit